MGRKTKGSAPKAPIERKDPEYLDKIQTTPLNEYNVSGRTQQFQTEKWAYSLGMSAVGYFVTLVLDKDIILTGVFARVRDTTRTATIILGILGTIGGADVLLFLEAQTSPISGTIPIPNWRIKKGETLYIYIDTTNDGDSSGFGCFSGYLA